MLMHYIDIYYLRKIHEHSSCNSHSIRTAIVSNRPHYKQEKNAGLTKHKPMTGKPR